MPDTSTLVMKNVLTEDDFEDDDCLEESIGDIKLLVSKHARIVAVNIDKANGGTVYIEIEGNTVVASSVMKQLAGTMIGGEKASVSLKSCHDYPNLVSGFVLLRNVLTQSDLEDEDCLEESKADIAALAGRFGTLVKCKVNTEDFTVMLEYSGGATVAETAAREFQGMVIGGQTLVATAFTFDGASPSQPLLALSSDVWPSMSVCRALSDDKAKRG